MKNNTILILKRGFLFLFLLFILDFFIGSFLKFLYYKQTFSANANLNKVLDEITSEIVIFGSSSANHHYNTKILQDSLKFSVFNAGRDGVEILFNNAIFNSIIKRYTPKVIILNLSPNELSTELKYDRLSGLLPYYDKYPEMKKIILLKSNFERYKLLSKIYPYNSSLLTILNGIYNVSRAKTENRGFIPIYGKIDTLNTIEKSFQIYNEIDSNRVNALIDIIDKCKERKILLYLFVSPVYNIENSETPSIKIIKSISLSKGVSFNNFIKDDRFLLNVSLFKDVGHMNYEGANTYTNIVVKQIKKDFIYLNNY